MVFCILLSLFSLFTGAISSSVYVSAFSLLNNFHVLVSLKQGFLSPKPALTSWNSSNPSLVCSWARVLCSQDRVVSLDLTDLDLSVYWWPGLELLKSSNLQVFYAYDNNFTALLPLGVLTLEKLKYLHFGGNYFYGKIPKNYGKLVGLEFLSLATNDLRGKILGELGNLTNLRKIHLGYCNVFKGGIPKEFGKLVNLVYMDLASCGLDDPIPHELGNLKLLDTFFLFKNLLSGLILKQLGNLTNLLSLDLFDNLLTGEIPYSFINLKKLKLLLLFRNMLHGSIPDHVADWPNLEKLWLWNNNFTSMIPDNLGQNKKLPFLDLSFNELTSRIPGGIPNELGKLVNLVYMNLASCGLDGPIPGQQTDQPALSLLLASLTEEPLSIVVGLTSSYAIWSTLETTFSHHSKSRELRLKDELQHMKKDARSVVEYSHEFKSIFDQLVAMGCSIDDLDKIHWYLRGLGSAFSTFSTTQLFLSSLPSFTEIIPMAKSYENFVKSLELPSTGSTSAAFTTSHSNKSASACGGGHDSRGGRSSGGGHHQRNHPIRCQIFHREWHYTTSCCDRYSHSSNDANLMEAFTSCTLSDN
ncbi:hypothetical protein Pint_36599 [Pistacia integerrima]|uniref:Uncharacterized protein n=1 Tax=Pistacia integerrima TaxID=434235 RepID=A0ACC0Y406_9ROSI|nr:hypothetical protein Pint_36599 [Pistacia integerrima]